MSGAAGFVWPLDACACTHARASHTPRCLVCGCTHARRTWSVIDGIRVVLRALGVK